MTDVNYSFSVGEQANTFGAHKPVYSFYGIKAVAGPEGTILLLNPRTHQKMMVQPEVADALRHCSTFRTLEAHAKHLTTVFEPLREHPDVALQTLQAVREAGMFESAETTWQRLTHGQSQQPVINAPCRVFILTCDRPTALDRLLESLAAHPIPEQVEGIWVIDDSRRAASIEQNSALVKSHAERLARPLHHFDLEGREQLIAHLKSNLPGKERTVDFLLGRNHWGRAPTYGLARNLALLLSVGQQALVLDDDVVAEAIAPPLAPSELRFGHPNDREAVLYGSRDEAARHRLAMECSPLDLMLDALGTSLSGLIQRSFAGPAALAGVDGQRLARYSAHTHLLLTQCGSWGDPGISGRAWPIYLPEASRERTLNANNALEDLLAARSVWMGYRGPTLTETSTMSQLTGIEHRALMPPYLPAGRGEDLLFALMMQRLHPEAAVWNAGWSIRHEPVDDRQTDGTLTPLRENIGLSTLAEWLGREPKDQWGLSPQRRLAGIAEEVRRLAEMAEADLNALLSEEQLSRIGASLTRVMQQLNAASDTPETANQATWRTFLEASRDQLVTQVQTPEVQPLNDVAQYFGAEGLTTLRQLGHEFADALEAWPDVCVAAKSFSSP